MSGRWRQPFIMLNPQEALRAHQQWQSSISSHGSAVKKDEHPTKGAPVPLLMESEDMTASPPRLLPISGVLVAANPAVVRPVAFRPGKDDIKVSSGSVLTLHPEKPEQCPSGYHSAPLLERQPWAAMTRTAFHTACCRVPTQFYQSGPQFYCKERAPSGTSSDGGGSALLDILDSGHSSAALLGEEGPSPSDSGIAELEAQLREKDAEIAYLRQTLECNEEAIIQVYAEKEESWRKRLADMHCKFYRLNRQHDMPAGQDGSPAAAAVEGASWLDTPQLDSEVAELTTLMEDTRISGADSIGEEVRALRLELQHCRRQLQLALKSIDEERQHWQHERNQAAQFRQHLETSYWELFYQNRELLRSMSLTSLPHEQLIFNQNRELLRAVSRATLPHEQLDGWYHSESSC